MEEEIGEVEMLAKKGDAVIDLDALTDSKFSLKKKHHDMASTSKNSKTHGATYEDRVQILVQKLEARPGQPHVTRPVTIFRVPILHNNVKDAIEPKMVSIGPYHHGKEALRPIEDHKLSYLRDFLARKPEIGVEVYLREMEALEKEARQCYNDVIEMSANEFALMLLLDGCFILEYYLKCDDGEPDYVTDVGWMQFLTDSLQIENQIPFSIIHKLGTLFYDTVDRDCKDECPVRTLVCKRMGFEYWMFDQPELSCEKIHHLLHFYQLRMTPPRISDPDQSSGINKSLSLKARCLTWLLSKFRLQLKEAEIQFRIPSAMNLHEDGIIFKEKIDKRDLFDITFEDGVLKIPRLALDTKRKVLFTNLLLYEQAQEGRTNKIFTSYLLLMDFLMDTSGDVALLVNSGVIVNYLSNDEEVAAFFNHLSSYTNIHPHENHFWDLIQEVANYGKLRWKQYRAALVGDFFGSNRWVLLSFIAAILLLLLTTTQTGFSIYPVVHPK